MTDTAMTLPPQAAVRYALRQPVVEDDVSITYIALDRSDSCDTGLRIIRKEMLADQDAVERYLSEAQVVAGWSHEHIVKSGAPRIEDGVCYAPVTLPTGMSLLDNLDVMSRVKKHFSLWESVRIAKDLCDALIFAHKYFPHLAIQPNLVNLAHDGTARLSGFGDHYLLERTSEPPEGSRAGWRRYASPEVLDQSQGADHRADQYAVAAVIVELLTGAPPSASEGLTATERNAIPKGIVAILDQALAPRPEQRFASMREFRGALDEIQTREVQIPWKRLVSGGAIVALAAIVGYVGFMLWPEANDDSQRSSAVVDAAEDDGASRPLLIPGKKTLYQRVLTRPGAVMSTAPNADEHATDDSLEIQPFSLYYVYERSRNDGVDWLQVGASSKRPTDGWLKSEDTIDWKQTLTVAFTNPSGRGRALFFESKEDLLSVMQAQSPGSEMTALRESIELGDVPRDLPVVAIEPSNHIDISQQFYLLPILDSDESRIGAGFPARALEVASVTMEPPEDLIDSATSNANTPRQDTAAAPITDFKTGIVFVVDSTISMGPYIERTRGAIEGIYENISHAGLLGKVSFGLLAFRDNIQAAPGLQYLTRTFAALEDGEDPAVLLSKIRIVTPADVSSPGFVEDAYAGVLTAIESMNWDNYGGRYIILVTDSGARYSSDPLSSTGMSAEQIRRLALDKGIAIYALHLLTDAGSSTHASAANQYQALAEFPNAGALYFSVDDGSVEAFGHVTDTLADTLVAQVKEAASGHTAEVTVDATEHTDKDGVLSREQSRALAALRQKTAIVGRAMQLAYLGEETGSKAPQVLRAWVTDRDMEQPDVAALDVRILLTKNQLSDLQQALKLIVEAAQSGDGSAKGFFDQLRGAAALMARNPGDVSASEANRLADLNLIGEYLDDLPYQSKVMQIDEDLWTSWSSMEQQAFIDEIAAKIRLYERFHDDVERWIAIGDEGAPGDSVYPVPLDSLP